MKRRPEKPKHQYDSARLVRAINLVDDLIAMKADIPPSLVPWLHRCRRVLRWHLKHSCGPQKPNGRHFGAP